VGVHPQEHVPEHGDGSLVGGLEGDPPGLGHQLGPSGLPVVVGGEVEVGEDRIEMVEKRAVAKALGTLNRDALGHVEVQQRERRLVAAFRFEHVKAPCHLGDHVGDARGGADAADVRRGRARDRGHRGDQRPPGPARAGERRRAHDSRAAAGERKGKHDNENEQWAHAEVRRHEAVRELRDRPVGGPG
jgi:hypothetical protein